MPFPRLTALHNPKEWFSLTFSSNSYPPKTTFLMQPMAHSAIKNMKGHYQSKIANWIIVTPDVDPSADVQTGLKTVNVLDCVHLVAEAWQHVKPTNNFQLLQERQICCASGRCAR
ncbi:unnamed protein product [Natator depressus]